MTPEHLHLCVADTPVGSRWMHKKTGNEYRVTGHVMIESTWRVGVMYESIYPVGSVLDIVRDGEEFNDGRFERLE